MTQHVKLAGLFTSVTQTGYDIHGKLTSMPKLKECSIEMVRSGDKSCNDCDILVANSLTTLYAVKDYLHSGMAVIVCDGPLVVSCLTTATPLDYTRKLSYKFEFKPIDFNALIPALTGRQPAVELTADGFDVLGMVTANSMSGGLILTELNRVQSYFDALARNRLRFLFINMLEGAELKPAVLEMQQFLRAECTQAAHKADAVVFFKKLVNGGVLTKLRSAMAELNKGKNIASVAKKLEIELFELNYLRRMTKTLDAAAARTETYASRTKTMASNS